MTGPAELPCPDHVLAAIAWYPDGLSDDQRGAVEAHAADCSACRDEIAMLRGNATPALRVPDPERVYGRVIERIAANERAESAPLRAVPQPAARAPLHSWGVPPAALAAGIAVALMAGLLGAFGSQWLSLRGDGGNPLYETAGRAPVQLAAAPADDALDVVFRADTTAEEIQNALRTVDGRIVAGPTRVGVYRVALTPGADLRVASARLKGDGRGVAAFAEPAAR